MPAGLLIAIGAIGCDVIASKADSRNQPAQRRAAKPSSTQPRLALDNVVPTTLCVTKGELAGALVETPTFRAVAPGHNGDAASIKFVVRGPTAKARALASGQQRRQVGLKLRGQDGCNLLYVMWRIDPKPKLEVSIKRNPGARTHHDCGARGYTKLVPTQVDVPPTLQDGLEHELRAEIVGDALVAWIDGRTMWQGAMPAEARELTGPAGVRSDNLAFELAAIAVDARGGSDVDVKCQDHDDVE